MAGLFNADTQLEALLERQRQQNQAQQQQFGQLYGNAARNREQAAANTIGAQIGASLGQGLAGGLFGEPEQIQRARQGVEQEQQVQQQLGKIDYKDPESLRSAGSMLIERGLPEAGMRLMQQAIQVGQQADAIKAAETEEERAVRRRVNLANLLVNPKDSEAARQAVLYGADPEKVSKLRGEATKSLSKYGKLAQDLGFQPGTPEYQQRVNELMLQDPSGVKIINQMGGEVPSKFVDEFGKQQAQKLSEQATDAETAVSSLNALNESIELINNNDIISGIGGNFKLGLSKVLAEAGVIGTDDIAATEAFFANQGNQVAQVITQFGAGTGLSDADREYAQKIAGGEISLTQESLAKLLNLQRKYLQEGVQKYNKKLESIDNEDIKTIARPLDIPKVPIAVPPNARRGTTEDGRVVYEIDGEVVDRFGEPVE